MEKHALVISNGWNPQIDFANLPFEWIDFCECPDNLITSYTRIYQALDSQCKLLVHVYMYLAVKELI